MISISHKAKQLLVFAAKLSIVVGAFYFIYYKLANTNDFNWSQLWKITKDNSILFILFIFLLSIINRFLEILKWQNLVSVLHPISITTASKHVLAALTAGIFTPNGVGEYAGKALYFKKDKTGTVLFLNLICNGIQMIISVVLGIIGLFVMGYFQFGLVLFFTTIVLGLLFFFTKNIQIKGYSFQTLVSKINAIPKAIHKKNIYLAVGRYLVFSHQYYFLFLFFGVELSYFDIYFTVTIVYFLSSSLPSFQFLDFAVKGSVALYFFQKFGISSAIVIFITTLMWFLNVVIPVLIGSYFVLTFKTNKNRTKT
jgi:hypothetical protein